MVIQLGILQLVILGAGFMLILQQGRWLLAVTVDVVVRDAVAQWFLVSEAS